MKRKILTAVLILTGLTGLLMSACGTFFALAGLSSTQDYGLTMLGILLGLFPGGVLLLIAAGIRNWLRRPADENHPDSQ